MGQGYRCTCKKCGYEFSANLGFGFMFPKVYSDTVAKMKKGTYGKVGKQFFKEYPNGAIACEPVVLKCKDCGEYIAAPELSMYIPKDEASIEKPKGKWSSVFSGKGMNYVTKQDLEENYKLLRSYEHHCKKCNGKMEVVDEFEKKLENGELHCGKCGDVLEMKDMILWD